MHIVMLKVLLTLTGSVFISGCAGVNPLAQLEPVPEIRPGILQGYLPTKELPNSLVGKLADMIVLDKNLFEIDPHEIDKTKVLFTIMNGKLVYDAMGATK